MYNFSSINILLNVLVALSVKNGFRKRRVVSFAHAQF